MIDRIVGLSHSEGKKMSSVPVPYPNLNTNNNLTPTGTRVHRHVDTYTGTRRSDPTIVTSENVAVFRIILFGRTTKKLRHRYVFTSVMFRCWDKRSLLSRKASLQPQNPGYCKILN